MHRCSPLLRLLSVSLVAAGVAASAQEAKEAQNLTVVSWGGAYEAAQRAAVVAPFEARTGAAVDMLHYDGTAAALAKRAEAEGGT